MVGVHDHPLASEELFAPWVRKFREEYGPEVVPDLEISMGEHSHSWLTGDEMLDWYAHAPTLTYQGILSRERYAEWNRQSRPDDYCLAALGKDPVTVDDTEEDRALHPNWTHIRVSWQCDLAEELAYFFEEVRRLKDLHGEVRFVFGFG